MKENIYVYNNNVTNLLHMASYKNLFYFLVLLSIILLCAAGYFFYQYQKLSKNPTSTQPTAEEEAQKLSVDVGKLMLLPKDEIPTFATVTDINKLKDQSFFKNAADGNKVLIYPNSKLAIIYDPSKKIIINVGPINFAQDQALAQNIRIGLRNGTNVSGLTRKLEESLQKSYPKAEFVSKDNAKRTDYEKTIIILLNDSSKDFAEQMSKTQNFQIDKLPQGETKPPEADILIIIGKDKT